MSTATSGPPARLQAERLLLRHILKKVSRSFYLSLIILPRAVRTQISLAYLFCRIADTIADTRILSKPERLQALDTFREQFRLVTPAYTQLATLQTAMLPQQADDGERQLMGSVVECFRLLVRMSPLDQQYIRDLVLTLTQGMQMDLRCFPGEHAAAVRALPDLAALDQYTYYVAGVVGEFWTKMHVTHLPALHGMQEQALCQLGVSFGKGLQMTNILRDIAQDFAHGRCYLPEKSLAQLHVKVADLRCPETLVHIRPLLLQLAGCTLGHFDHALEYILRLPTRAFRLRLSCMWPLLFAIQTVDLVCKAEDLLSPNARIKIPRHTVYSTMLRSLGCLAMPSLFQRYYTGLRQQLLTTLHSHRGY
jgi:farnesyl-diphosphate farnesyltransferase